MIHDDPHVRNAKTVFDHTKSIIKNGQVCYCIIKTPALQLSTPCSTEYGFVQE